MRKSFIVMKRIFFFISIYVLFGLFTTLFAETEKLSTANNKSEIDGLEFYLDTNITDGPYIFYEGRNIIVKWVEHELIITETVTKKNIEYFKSKFKVFPDFERLKKRFKHENYKQDYQDVEKFIAISDIHGQYNLFVELLQAHDVIDKNGDWSFGNGHLVVNGDIFDRGEGVTETLWLVYQLSMQAEKEDGKVHYLMGNHEAMVLDKDLRYVNKKYLKNAALMDTTYDYLYSDNTFMGRWLRNRPLIISINNSLITHAGISPKFIEYQLTIQKTNKLYLNNIVGKPWETIRTDSVLVFLSDSDGPLWHREYFDESELSEVNLILVLEYFKKDYLIVGHTSKEGVTPLLNGKLFGIDSSIKLGKEGEILIYEDGEFFKGNLTGNRIKL